MKSIGQCSSLELDYYDLAYNDSVYLFSRSIGKLEIRNREDGVSQDEIDKNCEKIIDFKADLARLLSKDLQFQKSGTQIEPPTLPQIALLEKNLADVDKLIVGRRIVEDLVIITTNALNTGNNIYA